MKIAFVIGHTEKKKGAYSPFLKISEWDFYNEVVAHIKSDITVFVHDKNIKGYRNRVRVTAAKINKGDFDLVIEGHFNSVEDRTANGVETLYYFNSKKGKQYAQHFSELINEATGITLRSNGLRALINKNDRGHASVYYPKPPAILIEPFFGSNEDDCKRIEGAKHLACLIDNFIAQQTGIC